MTDTGIRGMTSVGTTTTSKPRQPTGKPKENTLLKKASIKTAEAMLDYLSKELPEIAELNQIKNRFKKAKSIGTRIGNLLHPTTRTVAAVDEAYGAIPNSVIHLLGVSGIHAKLISNHPYLVLHKPHVELIKIFLASTAKAEKLQATVDNTISSIAETGAKLDAFLVKYAKEREQWNRYVDDMYGLLGFGLSLRKQWQDGRVRNESIYNFTFGVKATFADDIYEEAIAEGTVLVASYWNAVFLLKELEETLRKHAQNGGFLAPMAGAIQTKVVSTLVRETGRDSPTKPKARKAEALMNDWDMAHEYFQSVIRSNILLK
ncbi:hypothetical protein Q31b_01820 [Novipirellula aureliae]|uniref:Uncharacterized protein n=1 Tax=Novipirellula aureliae TaxID=2527966 RepID=A0A5C6EB89_9BACT|nr:hypothetical protein [Novipirellula aureliae]TWU45011.1 hypothetical protein Q31b_01820 [Novipirellula aureliae]